MIDTNPTPEWTQTFGGKNDDRSEMVQQTTDDGYILIGSTHSFGSGKEDIWLIKTDTNGNMQWNKTFGGKNIDEGYSVQQTTDGGYILCGSTYTISTENRDLWLIKTDTNGNMQWNKTFNTSKYDQAYSVQQTTDGGYILCGSMVNDSFLAINTCLIKTDSMGNMQWKKMFGDNIMCTCMQQTSDGGFIMCGYKVISFMQGDFDSCIIKTDEYGNTVWIRTYGGNGIDYTYSMQKTTDNGYILIGSIQSFSSGYDHDIWLIKIDSNGIILWNNTYGSNDDDFGYSVVQTNDNGFLLCGYLLSTDTGDTDSFLIKTDSRGNLLWNKTMGGSEYDACFSIQKTRDQGYILCGCTKSYGSGDLDAWLIKISEEKIDLELVISNGFGINVDVKNNDVKTLYNLSWSINISTDSGIILSGENKNGMIDTLEVGETTTIKNTKLLGFAKISITVYVNNLSKQQDGLLVGPFVLIT